MTRWSLMLAFLMLATPAISAEPSHDESAEKAAGPKILVEPENYDFGRAPQNKLLKTTFKIKNLGNGDLLLEKPRTSCGCTAALAEDKVVKPGASTSLDVSLKTGGGVGRVERSIYVLSNDPARPRVQLHVAVTVEADTK
jgi:hypothetical protein